MTAALLRLIQLHPIDLSPALVGLRSASAGLHQGPEQLQDAQSSCYLQCEHTTAPSCTKVSLPVLPPPHGDPVRRGRRLGEGIPVPWFSTYLPLPPCDHASCGSPLPLRACITVLEFVPRVCPAASWHCPLPTCPYPDCLCSPMHPRPCRHIHPSWLLSLRIATDCWSPSQVPLWRGIERG